jgi:hypothetical protein
MEELINKIKNKSETVTFNEVIECVEANYNFTPTKFTNGDLTNDAGQNSGSCKLFAFAKQHKLNQQQTLHCFGDYYRKDVLADPNGDGHQNIRNFMKTSWDGIKFNNEALQAK